MNIEFSLQRVNDEQFLYLSLLRPNMTANLLFHLLLVQAMNLIWPITVNLIPNNRLVSPLQPMKVIMQTSIMKTNSMANIRRIIPLWNHLLEVYLMNSPWHKINTITTRKWTSSNDFFVVIKRKSNSLFFSSSQYSDDFIGVFFLSNSENDWYARGNYSTGCIIYICSFLTCSFFSGVFFYSFYSNFDLFVFRFSLRSCYFCIFKQKILVSFAWNLDE